MNIKQTSLQAYNDIQEDGTASTQKSDILNFIKRYDGLLRREISELICIPINAVTGRCRELVKEGLIYEDGTKKDGKTGKKAIILKASQIKIIR